VSQNSLPGEGCVFVGCGAVGVEAVGDGAAEAAQVARVQGAGGNDHLGLGDRDVGGGDGLREPFEGFDDGLCLGGVEGSDGTGLGSAVDVAVDVAVELIGLIGVRLSLLRVGGWALAGVGVLGEGGRDCGVAR
jgi:hypothetical protein